MAQNQEKYFPFLKEIEDFPQKPGVYLMKDQGGQVLYVGKAKSLKSRVRSYFSGSKDIKTSFLVGKIHSVEYILTKTEYEALLLENNLIKKMSPRYNINLKDGKSYPVIKVTNEDFPRIYRTRRILPDGASYYGPYPQAGVIDLYLELIEKLFPLRKCRGILKRRDRPCLYYHIQRCSAPCCGQISREEYQARVKKIERVLKGNTLVLKKELGRKMEEASSRLLYEKAAGYRNLLQVVEKIEQEPQAVDFSTESRDYLAWALGDKVGSVVVLQMRGGKLEGRDLFRIKVYTGEEEIVQQFLLQYYGDKDNLPEKIYLLAPLNTSLVGDFFKKEKKTAVDLLIPDSRKHRAIINMALENCRQDLSGLERNIRNTSALKDLKKVLGLAQIPKRIEGFDIAQVEGTNPVASMVSFWEGRPDKSNYRLFHIKSLDGAIDDYEAMREVIARRYARVVNENLEKPDLILVDGGKGQVSAAQGVLNGFGLNNVPLAGLAKKLEEIHLPGEGKALRLPEGSAALKILQYVRDEAHRFATTFNKKLRKQSLAFTLLEQIPGIGSKRSRKLVEAFRSLETVMEQEPEYLAKVCGVPLEKAREIKSFLKGKVDAVRAKKRGVDNRKKGRDQGPAG